MSKRICGIAFLCLALSCFSALVFAEAGKSIWKGEITGMAKGGMELTIADSGSGEDEQVVKGDLVLDVESAAGYSGEVKGKLKGKIKSGLLKAKFTGWAQETSCYGDFVGTLSETQGFGTWKIDAHDESAGRFTGEWTLEKQ